MSAESNAHSSPLDTFKWVLVLLIVAAGVAGNWYFAEEPLLYRILALLVMASIAVFTAASTAKGSQFSQMLKASWREIKKVVWPTRQETVQVTALVVLVVLIMGLLLWALDSALSVIISKLIG